MCKYLKCFVGACEIIFYTLNNAYVSHHLDQDQKNPALQWLVKAYF